MKQQVVTAKRNILKMSQLQIVSMLKFNCMRSKMHKFNFKGYALEEKTVGRGNASSSRVNLPLSWVGKKVAVVLLEEVK